MRIGELEFRDKNGNEINPTKEQMATLIRSLNEENKQLKEQLDTLNKTIIRLSNEKADIILKEQIDYLSFAIQIREQVCDEMREKLLEKLKYKNKTYLYREQEAYRDGISSAISITHEIDQAKESLK